MELPKNYGTQMKWVLQSGRFVEDVMFDLGSRLTNEHPVHSFVLSIDDEVWKGEFSKDELDEIMDCEDLPDIQQDAADLFAALEKKNNEIMNGTEKDDKRKEEELLDALSDVVYEAGHYDYRTNYNIHWLQSALTQLLSYYKFDVIANILPNSSEMDFASTFWSVLDRCFYDIKVIPGRNRTCMVSSARVNANRNITGTNNVDNKRSASRPDLLLIKDDIEYGCSEVGKSDDAVASKKEVVETYLHSLKTMKDLFNRITQEINHDLKITRKLKVVCFHHTGYVCRVQETEEYKVPRSVKSLAAEIIPMLTLTLQAKTMSKYTTIETMTNLVSSYKNKAKGKPQFKAKKAVKIQEQKEHIILPSSLTFTPSTTLRKRKTEELN
ncbi:hypothetical protein BDC45DRAFT_596475 [Circinella umbellata]|nr:hypothetical protein BDC45DRAFT_596475 [Circinella umbellata]